MFTTEQFRNGMIQWIEIAMTSSAPEKLSGMCDIARSNAHNLRKEGQEDEARSIESLIAQCSKNAQSSANEESQAGEKSLASEVFDVVEKIRVSHNGVFGIRLYLGHDGHFACDLEDYDKVIGHGESGRCILEAIERAQQDQRFRILQANFSWGVIMASVKKAVAASDRDDSIFTSAEFLTAINQGTADAKISQQQAIELLSNNSCIVRLHGGSHWLLLPNGHRRHEPELSTANNEIGPN